MSSYVSASGPPGLCTRTAATMIRLLEKLTLEWTETAQQPAVRSDRRRREGPDDRKPRCGIASHRQAGPRLLRTSAVAASAGKNDSRAISDSVTSSGVPKMVVVLKNDRTPAGVAS